MGLGTGGLDTQAIRKSFFLLDFPEVERRQGSGQLLVLGWAEVGREVTQAPGPHYLPLQTWIPKGQCDQCQEDPQSLVVFRAWSPSGRGPGAGLLPSTMAKPSPTLRGAALQLGGTRQLCL